MKNKKVSCKRAYCINIPQMLSGRLSENWLMKELGDIHWEMISDGLQVPTGAITDSNGERLYASFVRIQWISSKYSGLGSFHENDGISIDGQLTQYKAKTFLSHNTIVNNTQDTAIDISMVSVFSSRKANDNEKLIKGTPLQLANSKVSIQQKLPEELKTFFRIKNYLFTPSDKDLTLNIHQFCGIDFQITGDSIYTTDYEIDPYDDINGVGLLYFASYSKISDKCERHFFEKQILNTQENFNWATFSDCVARDIHFYGNANPKEQLIYELDHASWIDDVIIQLTTSLYRKKGKKLIAKIFTIKKVNSRLILGSILNQKKEVNFLKKESIQISSKKEELKKEKLDIQKDVSEKDLQNTIITFLESIYENQSIENYTDLRKLGIESITYTELSEFLNVEHGLRTNPSHFYELYTINDIIDYCLDRKKEPKIREEEEKETNCNDIAIVGVACKLPGANKPEDFWENLKNGISSIIKTPEDRWEWPEGIDIKNTHEGINIGGYIEDIDLFDPLFFAISPREALTMDPQQRMLLQLTWELLENTKKKPSHYKKSNTGVFIGVSGSDYEHVLLEKKSIKDTTPTGNAIALLANRISYYYDFEGPSISIDTACSSSLISVAEAVKAIQQKQCDQAIIGGIHIMCHPKKHIAYYNANMLSKDGKCHTFDEKANGYVRGEGAVMMLLKPLYKAKKEGDEILGVIKSSVVNHGGYSGGITVPNPFQQQKLITKAYQKAGIQIETISYIETHGTGTKLGDPIEIKALSNAFKELKKDNSLHWKCGLGSVKTNIGHLEAASGLAGLLKVILSMQKKYLPPTINFEKLNPYIELETTPFRIQDIGEKWESSIGNPLRAGISSFGIGGTNAHVVIEEYEVPSSLGSANQEQDELNHYVFVLSAINKEALERYVHSLYYWLQKQRYIHIASFAYSLQTTKEEFSERLAFTFKDYESLIIKLENFLSKREELSQSYYTANTKEYKDSQSIKVIENQGAELIAMRWSRGENIEWEQLYNNIKILKITLPNYPFAKKRFWIGKKIREKETQNTVMPIMDSKDSKKIKQVAQKSENILGISKIHLTPITTIKSIQQESIPTSAKEETSQENLEATLSKLLADLLYIDSTEITIEDTFLKLGLDSILGLEFIKIINKELALSLNTSKLYNYPTIKELTQEILTVMKSTVSNSINSKAKHKIPKVKLRPLEEFGDEKEIKEEQKTIPTEVLETTSDLEERLKELLCDVLYLSPEELDIEQTFVTLGLDSILGVELAKKIRKQWRIDFTTAQLYSYPTLKELVTYLEVNVNSDSFSSIKIKQSIVENENNIKYTKPQLVDNNKNIRDELRILICDLLYLEVDEIEENETFIKLGLDSVLGVELIRKINKKWQLSLATAQIYNYPSILELSNYIGSVANKPEASQEEIEGILESEKPISNIVEKDNLKEILADILYLEKEEISFMDTFIELGLDSILGVEFIKKINKDLDIQCSTSVLYNYPSINKLHEYIQSKSSSKQEPKKEKKKVFDSVFKPIAVVGNIEKDEESNIEYHISPSTTAFLRDHRVFNQYILPTDAYIELIVTFFKEQFNKEQFTLKKIRISEALIAKENEIVPIKLQLKNVNETLIRFRIYHKETQKVYVRGSITTEESSFKSLIYRSELPILKLGLQDLTDWTKDILSDSYFQVRKSLEISENFAKGIVAVTSSNNPPISYIAQWLDGILLYAIQYASISQRKGKIEGVMYLPYRIEEINIESFAKQDVDYESYIVCHEESEERLLFSIEVKSKEERLLTIQNLEVRKIHENQINTRSTIHNRDKEHSRYIMKTNASKQNDVAIIGMSCRFPGAENITEFWENLKQGVDAITEIKATQWQDTDWYNENPKNQKTSYSKWGGFIKDKDKFDPLFFGISPREAELMDPQHRVFLQECWHTIEDAGYTSKVINEKNAGVFVGASSGDYQHLLLQSQSAKEGFAFMGNSQAILAARIAFLLNLKGPALTVDTACSSSLVAIDRAFQCISRGEIDMALAGGVKLMCTPLLHIWTSQVGMASKDGKCKTFDNKADGIVSSEGVGVLLLKRLDAAIRDGDQIHAVIKGSGINQDGKTNGITAPSGVAQSSLHKTIYNQYHIDPSTIGHLETHGTGTKLGDPIEIEALKNTFGTAMISEKYCNLGSVKTNIGHAAEAAGISGVIKTVLMLKNRQLVPSLHFNQLNDEIVLDNSPFYINTELKYWKPNHNNTPRRGAISSFGFSGTNAHLVVEEYQKIKDNQELENDEDELIVISAKTENSLRAQINQIINYLKQSEESLKDIAYTLQVGRDAMQERLAVITNSKEQLVDQISNFLKGTENNVLAGTVEKRKKTTIHISQNEIETAIPKKNYELLAKAWIFGKNIDWSKIYVNNKPQKVSLPTYAFEKESYWVTLEGNNQIEKNKNKTIEKQLHPLLHRNCSTLEEFLYTTEYSGSETFYKDHIVNGDKVLAGVAYIEQASAALEEITKQSVWGLKNIFWQKPLIVNTPKEVHTKIIANTKNISYQIFTQQDKENLRHGNGEAILEKKQQPEKVDLRALKDKVSKAIFREDFYAFLKTKGFNLGPSFTGIEVYYSTPDFAISKISLPKETTYKMQPGALDSTLQNALGWIMMDQNLDQALPFSIKAYHKFVDTLPETFWSYARRSKSSNDVDKVPEYDVDILDETGNVLVQFQQCVFLPIAKKRKIETQGLEIQEITWKEIAYDKNHTTIFDDTIVYVIGADPILIDVIKNSYEAEVQSVSIESEISIYIHVFKHFKNRLQTKVKTQIIVLGANEEYGQFGFLSGMLKTLTLENPNIEGKVIAVDNFSICNSHKILEILNKERFNKVVEVKYNSNKRWQKSSNQLSFKNLEKSTIKVSGVYVLVGGNGGVGNIIRDYILKIPETKVIILGRNRESRAILPDRTFYYQCDSTDVFSVAETFDTIRNEFKQLNGIMYLAGLVIDAYAKDKTEAEITKVLEVKIQGVKNIDKETKKDPLDFMVLFSSIAAIHGNVGQIDYAAANTYLDDYTMFRESERIKGYRQGITQSINWPLWKNGGMKISSEEELYLEKKWGMQAMPDTEGIKALEQILNSKLTQTSVIYKTTSRKNEIEKEITSVSKKISGGVLIERLTSQAALLVKIAPNKIKTHIELGDYGFDSILFTQFCNEINETFDTDISPTVFFNHPTLEGLAEHLEINYDIFIKEPLEKKEYNHIDTSNLKKDKKPVQIEIGHSPTDRQVKRQVAIVGISGRFPGAANVNELWKHLENEKDLITEVPKNRWDWEKYYGNPQKKQNTTLCKWGGFLDGIDEFDSLFFHISPIEAELMDPQQRLVLQEVYHALEDATITVDDIKGSDTGVYIGVSSSDYATLLKQQTDQVGVAQFATGSAHSVLANRISYIFDLHGPSEPIDTACSSSLIAIHRAAEHIKNGHGTMAIAGGVNAILSPELTLSFSQAGMLSSDGRCKTFDQSANGYVRGEGVGILILKDLETAIIDKNPIYGIVKGSAENHGGKANTLTSPNPRAQQQLLLKAYQLANVDPSLVSYIEAHGTGTSLGDPIETEGLKLAFEKLYKNSENLYGKQAHCALGSIKANIGHLEAAAGVAGTIKVLLAIKNNKIPGNPLLKHPNTYLKLENTPFYLQRKTTDWRSTHMQPKIAGVSSFGFGGANAHIVLEEYYPNAIEYVSELVPVFVLSAIDFEGLQHLAKLIKDYLLNTESIDFKDVLYTLQTGRKVMDYRMAFVAKDKNECIDLLDKFMNNLDKTSNLYIGTSDINKLNVNQKELKNIYNQSITEIHKVAELWSKGTRINWDQLYKSKTPNKIALPTYPFKKNRYWFVPKKHTQEIRIKEDRKYHPLIQNRINKGVYESEFSGDESIFASHKVNGINVFPGAAQIEWIREIGSQYKALSVTKITDVVFRAPIQKGQNVAIKVLVELEETTTGVHYSFKKKEDPTITYSNGIIEWEPLSKVEPIEIDNISLRLSNSLNKKSYYKLLSEKGIDYGVEFQGIQEIRYSKKEVLAYIHLPEIDEKYMLSPFLLDSAIQTVMGLSFDFDRNNSTKLPFRVKEIKIYKPLPQQFWSYARKNEPINGETLPTYDVDLINESGEVLVKFEGFVALTIKQTSTATESLPPIDNLMYVSEWERVTLTEKENIFQGNVLLISNSNDQSRIVNNIREYLRHKHIEVNHFNGNIDMLDGITDIYIVHDDPENKTTLSSEKYWQKNELEVFKQLKKILSSRYVDTSFNFTVISDRTQKVLANDTVCCYGSGILGLMSSLAKEQKEWNIRIIDIDASRLSFTDIPNILNIPYDTNGEVMAYRNQNTYIRKLYPFDPQLANTTETRFRDNGVYVILGGAGGIGKVTTTYLVKKYQAQVIWLGRSSENANIHKAQNEIMQWGPRPMYIQCNALVKEDIENAYQKIKDVYPNINGVFHSALVLKDSLLNQMDEIVFTEVFESKATASHNLINVFAEESLDFICFYSSIQSQVNALGQANYAAASMYKDSLAYTIQQQSNIPTHIINWGFWGSVGVVASETYRKKMNHLGVGSIEPDEGMAILEEVIGNQHQQVIATKFV